MIAPILLFLFATLYRVVMGLSGAANGPMGNFSPFVAIALCGAIYLPARYAVWGTLLSLLISDLLLDLHYGAPFFSGVIAVRYLVLGMVVLSGVLLRGRNGRGKLPLIAGTALAGSFFFYVVTNTFSWLGDPAYAKTGAGLLQALTTGVPGYIPTWMFLRNSLLSDVGFTILFYFCCEVTRRASEGFGTARVGAPESELATVPVRR